jgi:phosphoribosylaminoimidazole carboxylase
MLNEAAARLNLKTCILDIENAPAKQISNQKHIVGSFKDADAIKELAQNSSILTVEIEHVDADALQQVESNKIIVQPNAETIRIIQDKFLQKTFISNNGDIPITPFMEVKGDLVQCVKEAGILYGYPLMLKSKTLAYDGKGNKVVYSEDEIQSSISALGGDNPKGPQLYVEKWVAFKKELAVIVAKSINGELLSYPCVETVQKNNICHLVIAPAQISGLICEKARKVAENVVKSFSGIYRLTKVLGYLVLKCFCCMTIH